MKIDFLIDVFEDFPQRGQLIENMLLSSFLPDLDEESEGKKIAGYGKRQGENRSTHQDDNDCFVAKPHQCLQRFHESWFGKQDIKYILDSFPVEVVGGYEITDDRGKVVLGDIDGGAF